MMSRDYISPCLVAADVEKFEVDETGQVRDVTDVIHAEIKLHQGGVVS